jgi:thiosulfate/3-mercaptopyruvate sulfurtransferase
MFRMCVYFRVNLPGSTMPTLDLIIEPAALEAVLDDSNLLIVDVCAPQNWKKLHIPGAVHINPSELVCGIPPASGMLPTEGQLRNLFARIGYRPEQHIVVYDDEGGGWAARFIWTLDIIGHRHYSFLNGGLLAWYREGHPVTNEIREVIPTEPSLKFNHGPIAELQAVKDAIGKPDIAIWDARSAEEYVGLRSSSARAGHIPGAVNLDWLNLMDRNRNLRLHPLPQIQAMLDKLGITRDKHIITHCQSHHRSSLSYFVARALGYSAQGYHGSWGEWGNMPDTPIETFA